MSRDQLNIRRSPFDYDVFISYSHIDDQPLAEGRKGWITILHEALHKRLAQLRGETPKIWRDKKLSGNDCFDKEIIDQLVRTAALVSVLSPRYLKSDWCCRELQAFLQAADRCGNVNVGNKSRIFKVVKTPIEAEQEPPLARRLLGYLFYKEDSETGRWREFDRAFGQELEPEFWRLVDDLAQDISKLLESIRSGKEIGAASAAPNGAIVYLAETTSDLTEERNQVRRELEAHGHIVLPDQPLPITGMDLENVINGYLQRACLSIHLVGAFYGVIPEAHDRSLFEIQNSLATQLSQAHHLTRLIWMPSDLKTRDERQEAFVEALNNDPKLNLWDSVLQTDLEELKAVIHDKLSAVAKVSRESKPSGDKLTRLYLIFDQRDEDAVAPLDEFLYEQGFEVKKPLFFGDECKIQQDHERKLRLADAVLIYYGSADEAWLDKILMELATIRAHLKASAIYLAGPETKTKVRFRTREVDVVIKRFDAFAPESLAPLLEKLEFSGSSVH